MAVQMYKRVRSDSIIPRIRLGANVINFNPPAAEKYLSGVNFVEMGYDDTSNEIVLIPKPSQTDFSIKVQNKNDRARAIAVYGFVKVFKLDGWISHILDCNKCNKKEIRLSKGEKTERKILNRPKYPPHPKKKEDDDPQDSPGDKQRINKKIDYKCSNCGHTSLAWKYAKSMQPNGHPKSCPKCGGGKFVPDQDESNDCIDDMD